MNCLCCNRELRALMGETRVIPQALLISNERDEVCDSATVEVICTDCFLKETAEVIVEKVAGFLRTWISEDSPFEAKLMNREAIRVATDHVRTIKTLRVHPYIYNKVSA